MYGPYEHEERLVASVIRALLRHEPARCSHGNQIRDYLFVQDAADAFIALLESSVTGPINIAYGTPVALRDIVTRIGALLERPDLIHLGAIPAAPTDLPLVAADVAYARKVLSWTPRIDFDEGLMRSIEWWREQLFVTEGQRS
jgi:nucleoside-diphosphate-sugar epimerase